MKISLEIAAEQSVNPPWIYGIESEEELEFKL